MTLGMLFISCVIHDNRKPEVSDQNEREEDTAAQGPQCIRHIKPGYDADHRAGTCRPRPILERLTGERKCKTQHQSTGHGDQEQRQKKLSQRHELAGVVSFYCGELLAPTGWVERLGSFFCDRYMH